MGSRTGRCKIKAGMLTSLDRDESKKNFEFIFYVTKSKAFTHSRAVQRHQRQAL